MPLFDVLGLIPQGLQREIADSIVDFVSEQAEKFLGDQVADKLKKLRSDAAFVRAFQDGSQRAADRFVTKIQSFETVLLRRKNRRRVDQAVTVFLSQPVSFGVHL